jgi:shikimate kinase
MKRAERIILTGFSGTGKTEVARLVAERLGWQAIDSDDAIVEAAAKPIPDIFRDHGENHFRALEQTTLRQLCSRPKLVIAAGGGAILDAKNRRLMAHGGFIVCLEARPETILERLRPQLDSDPVARPLLATPDPLRRIRELKSFRQPYYALADHTVHTDGLTTAQVAAEVIHAWRQLSATVLEDEGRLAALAAAPSAREADAPYCQPPGAACVVRTSSATYPVFVSWGALPDLGQRMADAGLAGRAYLISDSMVHARWGAAAEEALQGAGFRVASHAVSVGETS